MTVPAHDSPTDRFTDVLWDHTKVLRDSIDNLEFLRCLGDGTLPLESFRFYIEQDALYLAGYAKALALLASKAPDPVTGAFWATSSATAATEESSLHRQLLTDGVLPVSDAPVAHSPACLGYVSYLTATVATEPYPVGAAAVLSCFWIYAEVCRDLAPAQPPCSPPIRPIPTRSGWPPTTTKDSRIPSRPHAPSSTPPGQPPPTPSATR